MVNTTEKSKQRKRLESKWVAGRGSVSWDPLRNAPYTTFGLVIREKSRHTALRWKQSGGWKKHKGQVLLMLRYGQQVKLVGSGREKQGEHYAGLAQGIPSCSNAGGCTNDKHF